MSSTIDAISQAIGELRAEVRRGNDDRGRLFRLVEVLDAKLDEHVIEFRAHIHKEERVLERLGVAEGEVRNLNRARWIGLGILAAFSLGGGAAGAHLPSWLVQFLGR